MWWPIVCLVVELQPEDTPLSRGVFACTRHRLTSAIIGPHRVGALLRNIGVSPLLDGCSVLIVPLFEVERASF